MATTNVIRSKCPVCGKLGTQSVYTQKGRPDLKYLRFVHSQNEIHYIGRVRSEGEFEGELNKPETKEEYESAIKDMAREINQLVANYSKTKSGSVERITKSLRAILSRYGY